MEVIDLATNNRHELINDRQYQFIIEYLDCLNGSEAYRRVYPNASVETSYVESSRLLSNPNIKLVIQELMDEQKGKVDVTVSELIYQLKDIIYDEKTATRDKIKAIELLGKHLDMWTQDITNVITPVIKVSISDEHDNLLIDDGNIIDTTDFIINDDDN